MALQHGPNETGALITDPRNPITILAATGERPVKVDSIAIMSDAEGSAGTARGRTRPVTFGPCCPLIF
jgi:hypothetical protein